MKWLWLSLGLLLVKNFAIIIYARRIGNQNFVYNNYNHKLHRNEFNKNRNEGELHDRKILPVTDQIINTIQCPLGCVCQYAHFLDLPISRWINYMQTRTTAHIKNTAEASIKRESNINHKNKNSTRTSNDHNADDSTLKHHTGTIHTRRAREIKQHYKSNYKLNNSYNNNNEIKVNEVTYETEVHKHTNKDENENEDYITGGDQEQIQQNMHTRMPKLIKSNHSTLFNVSVNEKTENERYDAHLKHTFQKSTRIKQATCILQEETLVTELVQNLPQDLQALILLYTDIGRNKTVNTSVLKPLKQLKTLEIRGLQDRTLKLVFDAPLQFIQHANFEFIELLRGDTLNRPRNVAHPSDSYNYKPNSEFTLNVFGRIDMTTRRFPNLNVTNDYDKNTAQQKHLDFESAIKELEILPYHVYMQRMKEAHMPSFYDWSSLEVLRIHSCELSELYWEMFDGLGALQHLSLERNNIKQIPPFALYGALHIKTLSLAHNLLHELHYQALAGLLELTWLDLSDNRLGWLSEISFPPFPKLKRIDFTKNPIKFIYPAAFWVMNDTREMIFDSLNVSMELWNDAPFGSLRHLRELHIGNISLISLEQNVFKGLTNLKFLRLRGTIKSIEFDAFASLIGLIELDMNYCNIQKISMDALIGCKQLEIIRLAYNVLSYIPPGLFDDQIFLKEIYLNGNQLYTLPNNFFLLPHLRLARLNENPWICSCEMENWRPRITNQQRGTTVERCITNFQTGAQISCKDVDDLQFNRSLAPRCENFNGRSVFYVLRKQIQCGPGRLIHKHPTQTNIHKNIMQSNTNKMLNEINDSKDWQNLKHKKHQIKQQLRNPAHQNTLQYVLHFNKHKQNDANIHVEEIEISNNI